MAWTVYACETVTGLNQGPLDCAVQSWNRVLNGAETAAVQLQADTEGRGLSVATRDFYRQLTEPARMSLVLDWDGVAVWAGPVWNRQSSDSSVSISAASIATLLTRRKAIDPLSSTPLSQQVLAYSGLSLATIAKRLVQFTMARTGGRLPIVLPADEGPDSDPTHVRNYQGADLSTIGDLLSQLTGVLGGPDIDFRPVWTDSSRSAIQWQMVSGTAAAPMLTSSNQLAWEYGTPQAGVRSVQVTEDASVMATDQWAKGGDSGAVDANGDSLNQPLLSHASSRTYLDLGWPLLEAEADYTDVTVQGTLDAHTAGDLTAVATPTHQWALTVDAYGDPQLGTYALGDLPTVHVAKHFWIPDGTYGMRIVGFSGDSSNTVAVQVQDSSARALYIPGSPEESLPARVVALERQQRSSSS
jgi:hypothetical protein